MKLGNELNELKELNATLESAMDSQLQTIGALKKRLEGLSVKLKMLDNGWILHDTEAYDPDYYVIVLKEPTEEMVNE